MTREYDADKKRGYIFTDRQMKLVRQLLTGANGSEVAREMLEDIEPRHFSDFTNLFGDPTSPYAKAAIAHYQDDGTLEFDDPGIVVGKSDDPGAYVMGWKWVSNEVAGIVDGTDDE